MALQQQSLQQQQQLQQQPQDAYGQMEKAQQSQQHIMGPTQSKHLSLQLLIASSQLHQSQGAHDTTNSMVLSKVRPGSSQFTYVDMQEAT
eukprot:12408963-Karenia_brevis.AAC.1